MSNFCDRAPRCYGAAPRLASRDLTSFARRVAGKVTDERSYRVVVRRVLEVNLDRPGSFRLLAGRYSGLASLELLNESIEEPACGAAVGDEPGEHGSPRGRVAHASSTMHRNSINGPPQCSQHDAPYDCLAAGMSTLFRI